MLRFSRIIVLLSLPILLNGCIVLLPLLEQEPKKPTSLAEVQVQEAKSKVHKAAPLKRKIKDLVVKKPSKVVLLMRELKEGNEVVRTHAATDLGYMAPRSRVAIPALSTALLYDPSKWVRRAAAKALGRIGGRRVVQPLEKALSDKDKWVRHSVANVLKRLKKQSIVVKNKPSGQTQSPRGRRGTPYYASLR